MHTFSGRPAYVVALVVFLLSALLTQSGRAAGLRLVEIERDPGPMTRLSQAFLSDTNRESLLGIAADRLRDALGADHVSILLADEQQKLSQAAATSVADIRGDLTELAYRQGNSASFPSDQGGADIYLPIPVGVQRAGVLVARGLKSSERMAEGCAVLLGLALERERFLRLARAAEETRTNEEMKTTLLATLAHDLKTPSPRPAPPSRTGRRRRGPGGLALAVEQLRFLTRRIGEPWKSCARFRRAARRAV